MVGILLMLTRALTVEPDQLTHRVRQPNPAPALVSPLPHSAGPERGSVDEGSEDTDDVEHLARNPYVADDQSTNPVPPTPAILNRSGRNAAAEVLGNLLLQWIRIPQFDDDPLDPTELSEVTQELDEILAKWEAANSKVKTARIRFERVTYDLHSRVTKLADGEILRDEIDRFAFVIGRDVESTQFKSHRRDSNRTIKWITTQDGCTAINIAEKTFERFAISPEFFKPPFCLYPAHLGPFFRSAFMLDISSTRIRRQWQLTEVDRKDELILIKAQPRTAALRRLCKECRVAIDTRTWKTHAIKLYAPDSKQATLYRVCDRMINGVLPENYFTPDLIAKGYSEVGMSTKK